MLALRGRRQVGKSSVVERFTSRAGEPSVFVTAVFGASAAQHLADATDAIAQERRLAPTAQLLAESTASSWRDWLGRIALAAQSGPVIVVLDEFPWLAAAAPTLEGELQVQWDRTLGQLPVMLILVGSNVAMMDRLATHDRPLFGRLQPMVIPALNPAEVAEALPGAEATEVFDSYLVTGGYPRLVTDLADTGAAAAEFVRAAMLDPFSPLITTAQLSLEAEFATGPIAGQVLSAIGANEIGHAAFSEVLGAIADPADPWRTQTAVTRALKTLTESKGLIELEQPAWAAASSKLRRYRVTDPYLRFWFRYLQRHRDRIARGRADLAIAAFERDWPSWRGRSIEPVVRSALERIAATDDTLSGVESIRPWWVRDGSVEVDVVAATPSVTSVVGTIKWRIGGGVTERDLAPLVAARARVPRANSARLAAVSPVGAAPAGFDLSYSAADLLQAWT
jgi:AAA+ ATPase superfamily predicted ATPase